MDLDTYAVLLRLGIGAGIGFVIALTGIGTGVVGVPALTVLLGMSPSTAVGTTVAFASLSKGYAAVEHWRLGTVDLRAAASCICGALPGAALAALLVQEHATNPAFQNGLVWLIIATVVVAGTLMLAKLRHAEPAGESEESRRPSPTRKQLVVGALLGFMMGAIIASTSVGGGVLVIPVLALWFKLPMSRTVGTAIVIAEVPLVTATIVYLATASGVDQA